MRYQIALLIAAVVIGLGFGFAFWTRQELDSAMRTKLKEMNNEGRLPAEYEGADLDTVPLNLDIIVVELPRGLQTRLDIVRWMNDFCWVLAPLVVLVCLGVAALVGPRRKII